MHNFMFSVGAVLLPKGHLAASKNILGCHGWGQEVRGWDRCGDCYQHLTDKGSTFSGVQVSPHSNDVTAVQMSVAPRLVNLLLVIVKKQSLPQLQWSR